MAKRALRIRDCVRPFRSGVHRVSSAASQLLDDLAPTIQAEETIASGTDDAVERVDHRHDTYCWRCGASSGEGGVTGDGCAFCVGQPTPWDRMVRLGAYIEPWSTRIVQMKFHGQWSWARSLGEQLGHAIEADSNIDPTNTALTYVPMHWRRRLGRGYNQAELIARYAGQVLDLPVTQMLDRTRLTRAQTLIPQSMRPANVRDSVSPRAIDLRDWRVWLVDDVKTSGGTAGTCVRLLRRMGAKQVNVAVAAVADPRGGDFAVK